MANTLHVLLLCVYLTGLLGCSHTPQVATPLTPEPSASVTTEIPFETQEMTAEAGILNPRPGVYLTDDPEYLPLPTSGYDLYVIGEPHGQNEVRELAFAYLVKLYEQSGARSIILEQISPVYETDVNAYVLGARDTISSKWSISADILIDIRKFNDNLADGEKIRVYLTDLDGRFSDIYAHLLALNSQEPLESAEIEIPMLSKLKTWEEEALLALVSEMKSAAGDRQNIAVQLDTVADSIRWHFVTRKFENGEMLSSEFIPHEHIREERIAVNVQRVLAEQAGRSVLALYGGYHTQKMPAMVVTPFGRTFFLDAASWVQHTVETGISVYTVFSMGLSGQEGLINDPQDVKNHPEEIRLADGTTGEKLFAIQPEANILYIDLRTAENYTLRLGNNFNDVDAGAVYDSAVFFREVHPQVWEQYP
jgi:hypothetical protein